MRLTLQFALATLWLALTTGAAERTAHWRTFSAGELPIVSVTVSPRGRVLASPNDRSVVTILDGYTNRQVTVPDVASPPVRVYESRSGQLWTAYPEGLLLFQKGQWMRHFITEIRNEPLKPFHPISIVPADINRVFFLLAGRVMSYEAAIGRVIPIKANTELQLGTFYEMAEASDGGLLLSASNGIARAAGPLRQLGPTSIWQQVLLPANSSAENLQRPMEAPDGKVIVVGFDRDNPTLRHILTSDLTNWTSEEQVSEKLRVAWQGWGDTRWGMSHSGLYRYTGQAPNEWVREGGADTYFDVAVQTNGVFWLATSAGLIRYAPPLWRAPSEISAAHLSESACYAITEGQSALWLATIEGLIRVRDGMVERFVWPEDFEPTLAGIESLYETGGGQVLIGAARDASLFNERTGRFTKYSPESAAKPLGVLRDGSICIRVTTNNTARLERFDGMRSTAIMESLAEIGVPAEVSCAIETRAGDLWLGGSFGIARFRSGDHHAQIFAAAEGVFPERIQCIAEVAEDRLWAGGVEAIYEWRGARWERIFSGVQRVRAIVRAREGAVWAASADGVHQFVNGAWLGHDDEEGLAGSPHGIAVDQRGRVWAATSRGPAVYYPDADAEEPRTLTPTIMENEGEDNRGITARLNGVDKWNYTSPTRLLYSYRLDEGAWSPFTNNATASFQNLSGGPHYLQARAMDRKGNQDPSSATLEFAVTVPWSRDPRLVGVLALGVIAVIFFAGLAINRHLQLKRSYAEVERIVTERTAQLEKANQDLLHSQKMRALGTLAAGIAHDFNNILSIIKGSAQIIESNPSDKEKVLTRVNRIQTVVEQGAGIVRSMLGMGKVGDFTECDPAELVEESIRLLGDRFPAQVQVKYEKNGAPPPLTCSKGVIHQILLNLILNAVDASGGEGTILLRTRVLNDPGVGLVLPPQTARSYLAIDVVDEGAGIAPEALPRIFEPFYTTKGFSSRRGTGLGLSMVYELAKGLGYGLAVQSKIGQGSVFTLLAPLS